MVSGDDLEHAELRAAGSTTTEKKTLPILGAQAN
jgi:hypothetical protein